MKSLWFLTIVGAVLFVFCSPLYAGLEFTNAVSVATEVSGHGFVPDGWYKYTISFDWTGDDGGLSNWAFLLKPGCAEDDHLFLFDEVSGYSTGEEYPNNPESVEWFAFFEINDGSLATELDGIPLVKFEQPLDPEGDEADQSGSGTFWFYANILPQYGMDGSDDGIWVDGLFGKTAL